MHKDTNIFIKTILTVLIIIGGATGFNRALAAVHTREEEALRAYTSAEHTLAILQDNRELTRELLRTQEVLRSKETAAQRAAEDAVRTGKLQALRDAQATAQPTTLVQQTPPVVRIQKVQPTTPTQSRMQPVVVRTQARTTRAS